MRAGRPIRHAHSEGMLCLNVDKVGSNLMKKRWSKKRDMRNLDSLPTRREHIGVGCG